MQNETVRTKPGASQPRARTADDHEVAAILQGLEAGFAGDPAAPGDVALVLGSGAKVAVERGHLVVHDGEGWFRRDRKWNRATGGLRRLVIGAESGYLTLDALAWCAERSVAVITLDRHGDVQLASATYGRDDARLRRVQAAPPAGLDVEAARLLLGPKLAGQARTARQLLGADGTAETIELLAEGLATAATVGECRQLEASAAACYFDEWRDHPATTLRFTRNATGRVPEHWPYFSARRSVLARGVSARKAERPLNAMLNLLYKLAEIEAHLACNTLGLDPGIGFVHADMAGRDSLALDLLEPVRPTIDRFVLELIAERTFTRSDFIERADGSVRIAPRLVQECAGTMPAWAKSVAPHAEAVSHLLGRAVTGKWQPTTALTNTNLRVAQAKARARKTLAQHAAATSAAPRAAARRASADTTLFATCLRCGAQLQRSRHLYCEACQEVTPSQASETRRRRGRAIATARQAGRAYDIAHDITERPDPADFAPIRAALAAVTLRQIMDATGLSKTTASQIRSGRAVPHVRHWRLLKDLGAQRANSRD